MDALSELDIEALFLMLDIDSDYWFAWFHEGEIYNDLIQAVKNSRTKGYHVDEDAEINDKATIVSAKGSQMKISTIQS